MFKDKDISAETIVEGVEEIFAEVDLDGDGLLDKAGML